MQFSLASGNRVVRIIRDDGEEANIHALWLRERIIGPDVLDPVNNQRLYEPAEIPPDLGISRIEEAQSSSLIVQFSDGYKAMIDRDRLLIECGWRDDPEAPPDPVSWRRDLNPRPEARFEALEDPDVLLTLLRGYFRNGFCVIRGTPTEPGSLVELAQRFGIIRETNFGRLFDVETKPEAIDLAYTTLHLAAHTDNPYRRPVPGIQFLHCIKNSVEGGLSTIVDGLAMVERLAAEEPAYAKILEQTPVRFRYESATQILEDRSPIIERADDGTFIGIRLSSRVDYVPPLDPDALDIFYAARRRLHELAADPAFEIRYQFEPGMLLMMNNRRTLHGRTAFLEGEGQRHLQGCYIDQDGPDGLYRRLIRDR